MAMTTVVRRAASQVVPLAARAFHANPGSSYHSSVLFATVNRLRTTDLASVVFKPSFPSALRSFLVISRSDSFQYLLLKTLGEEIGRADPNLDKEEEVPVDFPFKIEDHPGEQIVTLTREYEDEQITVQVHMPSGVTGDYHDTLEHSEDQLPLVVRMSKNQGLCLEFACTAMPGEIFIDRLSVKNPNSTTEEDQIAYQGPNFDKLDEISQKDFHKCLKMRGIKPSATNFLLRYMFRKDIRHYFVWLKSVTRFIEI